MAFTLEHFPEFPFPPAMAEVSDVEAYLVNLHRSMHEFFALMPRDIHDGISVVELDDLANTSLADPGADRIVFWDDSDGQYEFLTANTALTITGNNLDLDHLGIEDLADPGADRIFFWDDGETASKWLAPDGTTIEISGTTLQVITGGLDHGGLAGLGDDDHPQYILHSLAGAANDFLVASGANTFIKKTLAETGAILEADLDHGNIQGLSDDDHSSYPLVSNFEADRATIATNWTDLTDAGATALHKHDHGGMDGLTDDDHTQYILHSLADAANNFLVASGANTFVKKTLAETGAILEADIQHDNLQGVTANEHIDWTNSSSNFLTSGTGQFTGNLGVGSGPLAGGIGIYVMKEAVGSALYFDVYSSGHAWHRPMLVFRRARNTYASPNAVASGDLLGEWVGYAYDGSGFINAGAIRMIMQANSTDVGDIVPMYMSFMTGDTSGVFAERLRITADGYVLYPGIRSGATQAGAGAAANEIWKTSSHASLPDNVVMIGV